jgi:hypothetical protein
MNKWIIISVITICIAGFTAITNYHIDPKEIKTAINKSLPILQSSSHTFLLRLQKKKDLWCRILF